MTTIQSTSKTNIFDLATQGGEPTGRQGLRFESASSAQGFAQVLHAFDRPPESELTKPAEQAEPTNDASVRSSDNSDEQNTSGSVDDETAGDDAIDAEGRDQVNTTGATDADGVSTDAQQVIEDAQSPSRSTDTPDADEAGLGQQAKTTLGLGLLVGQGDQAKLTIKGLVKSLQPQASPDLTAAAVSTRLGQDQLNVAQIQTQEIIAKQSQAPEPEPTRTSPQTPFGLGYSSADSNPADSLSDQPPQSARGPAEFNASSLGTKQTPAVQVTEPAKGDQARFDVQQARSTRVEVGASAQVTRAETQPGKMNIAQAAVEIGKPARAEGAMTARAVTGAEAAGDNASLKQLGVQTQKSPGSIVPDTSDQRTALMAQVQRGLASMLRSGSGDMTIQLTPAHLGTIRIEMKRNGDRVSVRMSTSNENARDLVSDNSKDLATMLERKGLEVQQIRVDLREPSTPEQGQGSASAGSDREAQQGQHQQSEGDRQPQKTRDDQITPLEYQPGDLDADTNGEIWTHLGLDATA